MKDKTFSFRELLGLANLISLSRIPLAVIMIIIYDNKLVFSALFMLAVLTDGLDGYVARKTRKTKLGAILDPLCDKVFVLILLLFLVLSSRMSLQALSILLIRDVFTTLLFFALLFSPKKVHFQDEARARLPGKLVTTAQFIALAWIALELPYLEYILAVVAVLSLVAIADYSVLVIRKLKN